MADKNNLEDVRAFIYSDELENYLIGIDKLFLPINSLEITGMGSQEIKHSNILAWIFDDNQHRLGYQVLEKFLRKTTKIQHNLRNNVNEDKLKKLRHYVYFPKASRNITVKREWKNIDLLIEDEANKVVIAIENKIDSELSDQLRRYEKIVEEQFPEKDCWDSYFIFLTPDGLDASVEIEKLGLPKDATIKQEWLSADYQSIYDAIKYLTSMTNQDVPEQAVMILKNYNELLIKEGVVPDNDLQELCSKIWESPVYKNALNILIKNEPNGVPEFLESLKSELVNSKTLGIGTEGIINLNGKGTDFAIVTDKYRKYCQTELTINNIDKQEIFFGFYVVRTDIGFWLRHNCSEYGGLLEKVKIKLNDLNYNQRKLRLDKSRIFMPANKLGITKLKDNSNKYDLTDEAKTKKLLENLIGIVKKIDECL